MREETFVAVVGVAWGKVLYVGKDENLAARRLVSHTAFAKGRSEQEAIKKAQQIATYARSTAEYARSFKRRLDARSDKSSGGATAGPGT